MKPYYQDDWVTLYHGDCRKVLPTLDSVDLVFTDPPYKHNHVDGGGFAAASRFHREGQLDGISSFDLDQYANLLILAAPMLIAFHSRDLIPEYCQLAIQANRSYDLHVWHKTNAIPFTANTWKSDIEYIALIWDKKPGWVQHHQSLHSKVWQSGINNGDSLHPTTKPIPLLQKYLRILSPVSVCDPFAGSGTLLRAAKDLGIRSIGIEIDERYCEIAANRCRQEVLPL